MSATPPIVYTWTDEAPALATHAFLPIVRAFAAAAGVSVETRDLSLAARILSQFPEWLEPDQRVADDLADLGQLVHLPGANIIKLPNISASVPQLKACVAELRQQGYALPEYPDAPATDEERDIRARYDRVKGSAVNPVLRLGNSDRRAPRSVKDFARRNPPRNRAWPDDSQTHVATMQSGDFRHNERSVTIGAATRARIEFENRAGTTIVLRDALELHGGEVVDATYMSAQALQRFLDQQLDDARERGLLFSLHLKATMMKVSDPILFGHVVRRYFADVFATYADLFARLGVNAANGLADLHARLDAASADERARVEEALLAALGRGPSLAMVDSDRGITNLHVPSDVIIDASMPPMIRDGGRMWNAQGELQDTKAVVPDSSYAPIYQAIIEDCQRHGPLDASTMGSVPNVGLMAMKAEEYGSHDTTFELSEAGTVRVVDDAGAVLLEHEVEAGDIWRQCRTRDEAIVDWVKLAVERARLSGAPAIFWLDGARAHDAQLITRIEPLLADLDTDGLTIKILPPADAMRWTLERVRRGEDVISVTGNVLRDYLTDLFPILEIGTSARMLSIVPLLNGGGLFETGAGGSAPKHVQQFEREGHLRWDSLGEYMALAASLQHLAQRFDAPVAATLGDTLDQAVAHYLDHARSPSRKVGELDNRGSSFYLALYWAEALAAQSADAALAARFAPVAQALAAAQNQIVSELNAAQGSPQQIGGYYHPDAALAGAAMRPSPTLNTLIDGV